MSHRPEVLVFVMKGCGACSQLKPLTAQFGAHYAACIDTRVVDVDAESDLADAMGIEATPTLIGVNPSRQPVARMEGYDGSPVRVQKVYDAVVATATSGRVVPFHDL